MMPRLATVVPALATGLVLFLPSAASAAVTIDWVTVGNPGNANDTVNGVNPNYGAVAGTYKISKYEVTIGQYTEFLNAVDPNGTNTRTLYNSSMSSDANIASIGFNSGAASGTKYFVIGTSNRPVTYVSWFDAARFSNWMHNGQGTGDTEFGAYALNGATTGVSFSASATALYRLPTEDEWYKAAHYDPTKGGTGGYWLYPTQSDTLSGNTIGVANSANYNDGNHARDQNGLPTYLTEVGAYGLNSDSYYGTFDQGGNVWEWNDAVIGLSRGFRGGAWNNIGPVNLRSSTSSSLSPAFEGSTVGFRLATIPEPSSILMVGLAGMALVTRRRRPAI